jgi:hypothetical protein
LKRVSILVLKEVIVTGLDILCSTLIPKPRYYLGNIGCYSEAVVSTFTTWVVLTLVLIFWGMWVQSAMDHDAILGVHETEKVTIDREASQVAERAAIALQQSRRLRSAESVAVPTWTGRSGTAGAPASSQRRFGSTTNTRLIASSTMSQSQARTGQNGAHPPAMGSVGGSAAGTAFSSADLLARVQERNASISGKCLFFTSLVLEINSFTFCLHKGCIV